MANTSTQSLIMALANEGGEIPYEVRVAGRFKMDRMIGSGSFGEVYMARDVETNRDVAVKFE